MGNYIIEISGRKAGVGEEYVTRQGGTSITAPNSQESLGAIAHLMDIDDYHRVAKCQLRLEGLADVQPFRMAAIGIVRHHNNMVDILRSTHEPIPVLLR